MQRGMKEAGLYTVPTTLCSSLHWGSVSVQRRLHLHKLFGKLL